MKYLVCAPVDPDFEKKIKNIRFMYDRNFVSEPVSLVVSVNDGDYGEMRNVLSQVERSVKGINAIKINLTEIELIDSLLVCYISENQKILRFKQSLFSKGNYFIHTEDEPFIPIINLFDNEYYDEIYELAIMECKNTEFFLRKIELFIEKDDRTMKKLGEFEI